MQPRMLPCHGISTPGYTPIAHVSQDCEECHTWLSHYSNNLVGWSPSLIAAKEQRENAIRSPLMVEHATLRTNYNIMQCKAKSLQMNNNTLQQEIAALYEDLEHTCADLECTHDECNDADGDLCQLCHKYNEMDRKHLDTIDKIHTELTNQPQTSLHCRKVAQRGLATSPSSCKHSTYLYQSSRLKSPMMEDHNCHCQDRDV